MEGHSDKDHHEKTEEILAALAKRNSPSRLPVQKEEYSSPVKKQTKRAPVQSKNNKDLEKFFKSSNSKAIIVRPDRFILSSCKSVKDFKSYLNKSLSILV